jgi:hypothetical protein
VTSQPKLRMLGTTFVGCVVAIAAVVGAGVVGETISTPRSALESNTHTSTGGLITSGTGTTRLALRTARAARTTKAKGKGKANIGPATVLDAEAQVSLDAGVDPAFATQALANLTVDWRKVANGWSIVFKTEKAGYLGLTLVKERRVEIYIRNGRPVEAVTHDLAHELGHVADVTWGSDDSRSSFLKARNLRAATPWWTCAGCTDLQVGAGDFAETFALLAAPQYKFYSELGSRPTATQLNDILLTLPTPVSEALRPTL